MCIRDSLCGARHHGERVGDEAHRQARYDGALFRYRFGAGLGGPRMSGRLTVVGLGPGDDRYLTPEARDALIAADALYGYEPYLDRVPVREGQVRHGSGNRVEGARAEAALRQAADGAHVAMVSGGDPGVFAMAAAVCGDIGAEPDELRAVELALVRGITAMLAVAARAGAPL